MSDDVDLYDDLPDLNFAESISKIDEERQYFKSQLDEKEADLLKTKERIAHLEKENKILEKNISSLYQTAVNEIKRKDQVIEDLRREKESLIFRRKGRQNHNKSTAEALDSNLPAKYLITPVKSTNSTLSSPLKKKSLVPSCQVESSPDISCDYKSSIECFSSFLVSDPVQEEKRDSCSRVNDVSVCISQINNKISEINSPERSCENNSSEISNTLPDKLFSDSSHTSSNVPHGSTSKERALTKNAKQLSSEDRRGRQNDDFSDKYYSRNRERSSYNNYRSSKLPIERSRYDRSWDHNSDRKYNTESYKEINFQVHKSRLGTCEESRRKRPLHSRRSPSPPQHSRRHYDRRRSTSKARTLSDNMRVAAQLKSKYSKARRERSVSCTPMKQQKLFQKETKLNSSCKPGELQSTVFPNVNVEDRFVSEGRENEDKLSSKEQCTEKFIDEHDCVQSKQYNSETSDKSCKEGKSKKEAKRREISAEKQCSVISGKTCITEHNTSAQSKRWSNEVHRNESFETEREVDLTNNKDNACEKLPPQQLRTPPSKNLIPLKISPSFEDPAIVKEKNFSFCVFNEQCEFKRPKRRRSVKLLVSDASDLIISNSSEKDKCVPNNDKCESGIAMKQNMDLCQQGSKDILEKSAFNEKKSPNKKRKLDSICEELKANLEKKYVMSRAELISDGSTNILPNLDEQISLCSTSFKEDEQSKRVNKMSNFSSVNSNTVNSIEIPERIIISKRRRKVCNLQDNVVQVISQVKSRLS